jgi:hypothetical protein
VIAIDLSETLRARLTESPEQKEAADANPSRPDTPSLL